MLDLITIDTPFDVSDAEVERALAACAGDARETIRALLIGQAALERELSLARIEASAGFRRRREPDVQKGAAQ